MNGYYRELSNGEIQAHIICMGVQVDGVVLKNRIELKKYLDKNKDVLFENTRYSRTDSSY